MTAPKPVKTALTSTTIITTTGTVHNKEAKGRTSHVHHSREVTTTIFVSLFKVIGIFVSQFPAKLWASKFIIFIDILVPALMSIFIFGAMVPLTRSMRNFYGNKSSFKNGLM